MPKFAVDYFPQNTGCLYKLGSSTLGSGVRKQRPVETMEELKHISGFKEEWTSKARPYGFHLTISDAIDFNLAEILKIEQEIDDILSCFNPEHEFKLFLTEQNSVTFRVNSNKNVTGRPASLLSSLRFVSAFWIGS